MTTAPSRQKEPATWELVLKRNPVERLKQAKAPLGIRDELPALIAMGYENVPEEDVVRLQWWGLYHDKPKVGTFMLRLKIPSGILPPAKLRAIGEVSNRYGRGDAELSTRQCIQLHWLRLEELPNVFADLDAAGITTAGGCGDTVRNITGCPVAGLDANELFDCTGLVAEVADFFYGNPDFTNLPRKHKYTIASCADRCNAPEINCVSLIGVVKDGRDGFAVKVGGGLSSVPRIARDLGVFVPAEHAIEILSAITNVWSEDLRYRVSRVKARLKFMVDDIGAEGMRERVEARLGRTLESLTLPSIDARPSNHIGVHAQKQEGLSYIGVPVRVGLASGRPVDRGGRPLRARLTRARSCNRTARLPARPERRARGGGRGSDPRLARRSLRRRKLHGVPTAPDRRRARRDRAPRARAQQARSRGRRMSMYE